MGAVRQMIVRHRDDLLCAYSEMGKAEILVGFIVLAILIGDWTIGVYLGMCVCVYVAALVAVGLLAEYGARHAPKREEGE